MKWKDGRSGSRPNALPEMEEISSRRELQQRIQKTVGWQVLVWTAGEGRGHHPGAVWGKTAAGKEPHPADVKTEEAWTVENEKLIEDILRHLDEETQMGVMRMSVEMDEKKSGGGEVSHKCCNMYGRPANETVGLLDCYTDMNAGRPDNER